MGLLYGPVRARGDVAILRRLTPAVAIEGYRMCRSVLVTGACVQGWEEREVLRLWFLWSLLVRVRQQEERTSGFCQACGHSLPV